MIESIDDLLKQCEEVLGKLPIKAEVCEADFSMDKGRQQQKKISACFDNEVIDLDKKRGKVDVMGESPGDVIDLDKQRSGDQKNYARKTQISTEKRKNDFRDKKDVPMDSFDVKVRSKAALAEREQIERRPPAKKYKITCDQCQKVQIVEDPGLIPPMVGDESPRFYCERCLKRRH